MSKSKLTCANIVATASPFSWSQCYHAGNIAAVVSVTQNVENANNEEKILPLQRIGKEIINNLETEYFTLENKNLQTIKQAIHTAVSKLPDPVSVELIGATVIDTILYIYIYGGGKVYLKRDSKYGILLEKMPSENLNTQEEILAASGFLEDGDIAILATHNFTQVISEETLFKIIDGNSPSEAAEFLAIKIHEAQQGNTSAIILSYQAEKVFTQEEPKAVAVAQETKKRKIAFPLFRNPLRFLQKFSMRKKIILVLALCLSFILIASIFYSLKQKKEHHAGAVFQQIFAPAQKKYEEGQNLSTLNNKLAREDFLSAKNILTNAQSKFPEGSNEKKQILALLDNITTALKNTPEEQLLQLKSVDPTQSNLLTAEIQNTSLLYVTEDNNNIYGTDSEGIKMVNKTAKKIKTMITNDHNWSDPGGFGIYLGNFYVLDKKSQQIIKFIQGNGDYGKVNYFSAAPSIDISKATALAIDGSIWIVTDEGKVAKFTKGKSDDLTISGLLKPLLHPTRIFTSVDANNIYILDNGNNRIVVLNKSGAYQTSYAAEVLKNAKDFEVLEKDKKIYVLSDGKVYQVDVK